MFGVSSTKVVKETQTILVPKLLEDDNNLFQGTVSLIEGVSDLVDPHFLLMFYRDLSPAPMMFLLLYLWI